MANVARRQAMSAQGSIWKTDIWGLNNSPMPQMNTHGHWHFFHQFEKTWLFLLPLVDYVRNKQSFAHSSLPKCVSSYTSSSSFTSGIFFSRSYRTFDCFFKK
jgi:hypothetical protein